MITGYNTDVEHDGVVYHVQTEDKGLDSPLILSLVYSGGAILASKRSRYEDLIASGFSDEALSERLKRQHLLICAAIHAGRVLDLKRMAATEPEMTAVQTPVESEPPAIATPPPPAEEAQKPQAPEAAAEAPEAIAPEAAAPQKRIAPQKPVAPQKPAAPNTPVDEVTPPADAYTVYDPRRQSPLGEQAPAEEGIRVSLLDEQEFRSGETPTLRILVSQLSGRNAKPMNGAVVSVKVLGTSFRPLIYSMKTQRDGVAIVLPQIPVFTSGRAAILIKAMAGGSETELRRVIHGS